MKKNTKEEELYIRRIYPIALSPSSLSLFFCLLTSLSFCFFSTFLFSIFQHFLWYCWATMRAVQERGIKNEREREGIALCQSISFTLSPSLSFWSCARATLDDILQSKQSTHIFQDRLATYRLQSLTMTTLRSHSVEICNCKTAQ